MHVLLEIHNNPETSQHEIGRNTHLSSSMVNNYIKDLKSADLIHVTGKTNRTRSYHLTKTGEKAVMNALLSYSAEIVQLYSFVKHEIAKILSGFHQEGIETAALFGVSETAEVVYAATKDTGLHVIGVVDNDINKQGKPFNGLIINPPSYLLKINPDAVIISSFGQQEEIYRDIRSKFHNKLNIKRLSDL